VVIVGATKEIGRAAVAAVSRARGMELAGAIDTQCIGQDAGEVYCSVILCTFVSLPWPVAVCKLLMVFLQISGMEEPLEIPVLNDLTMVLGSIAQVLVCIFTVKCIGLSHDSFRLGGEQSPRPSKKKISFRLSANSALFSQEQLVWLSISANPLLSTTMSSRYFIQVSNERNGIMSIQMCKCRFR
jgi:hypothetical protein